MSKEAVSAEKKVKLAVVVVDFADAAHVPGAHVQTTVKSFDLPMEIVKYIANNQKQFTTVSLALEFCDV